LKKNSIKSFDIQIVNEITWLYINLKKKNFDLAANSRSCYSNFQMLDQYTNNSETNVIVSINPVEWRVSEHDQLQVIEDAIATGLCF
jgi:hypothetical protein